MTVTVVPVSTCIRTMRTSPYHVWLISTCRLRSEIEPLSATKISRVIPAGRLSGIATGKVLGGEPGFGAATSNVHEAPSTHDPAHATSIVWVQEEPRQHAPTGHGAAPQL